MREILIDRLFQMSFSWSSPINPPSIVGLKPTTSFADALKRLAEHVEQKNRTSKSLFSIVTRGKKLFLLEETKANENSSLVHLSNDFSNRSTLTNENNGISSEQALRLYTQCVQEVSGSYFHKRFPFIFFHQIFFSYLY